MKRKSLVELGKLLRNKKEEELKVIDSLKNDNNPQVKEMVLEMKIRVETYNDILLYIDNGATWQF